MTNSFVEVSIGNVNAETAELLRKYLAEHSPDVQISARDSSAPSGGPAFPNSEAVGQVVLTTGGMSLRDYFAAKALMGMMASRNDRSPRFNPKDDATYVYQVADAMLAAREVVQ